MTHRVDVDICEGQTATGACEREARYMVGTGKTLIYTTCPMHMPQIARVLLNQDDVDYIYVEKIDP